MTRQVRQLGQSEFPDGEMLSSRFAPVDLTARDDEVSAWKDSNSPGFRWSLLKNGGLRLVYPRASSDFSEVAFGGGQEYEIFPAELIKQEQALQANVKKAQEELADFNAILAIWDKRNRQGAKTL